MYFVVIKPLMDAGGSPQDAAAVNSQTNTAPAQNYWNVAFTPFVQLFQANGSTNADGSAMNSQQYFVALKANVGSLTGDPIVNLVNNAEGLYSLLNPGFLTSLTHWGDQAANLSSYFQGLNYQTDVTKMVAYILYNYNQDLYGQIHGSALGTVTQNQMTNSTFAVLLSQLSALNATGGDPLPNLSAAAASSSSSGFFSYLGL